LDTGYRSQRLDHLANSIHDVATDTCDLDGYFSRRIRRRPHRTGGYPLRLPGSH
jgi:hypothetical protein